MTVNYGLNKVRFVNPVPAGSKVRSKLVISNIEEKSGGRLLMTVTHTIEVEGQERPACVADALTLFFF
jgi:acyl dehydratase